MSTRKILQTFDAWKQADRPMVLATVYETLGSTYSKSGHRILIAADGDYQGLVSGGCLEGDLAERASNTLASNRATAVTYDLRDEADDLWGLGVGCNGLIRVFLQPLDPDADYEPFASIAQHLSAEQMAVVATIINSSGASDRLGGTLIWTPDSTHRWRLDSTTSERLSAGCARSWQTGQSVFVQDESGDGVLFSPLKPVPQLLVLGAGLDAIPVVSMASELGWSVTVADHLPAYIDRGGFDAADRVLLIDPRELEREFKLSTFSAIVVMSHHLTTDQTYLAQLASVDVAYIGVLGPPARKQRLLTELGDTGEALRPYLRGPVGLDIGADSPESIALSIVAELQSVFSAGAALSHDPNL